MKNFKNSKTAKAVSGFVGFATALMMVAPGVASADTIADLTAQINALLAQVAALQAAQGGSTVSTSGYQFTTDLTLGSKGADVVELQKVLVAKGHLVMPAGVAMGYFGNLTKTAVAAWQASAGIAPAAGYVGPKSRAALNAMGGVVTVPTTPGTTPVVPGTGVSASLDASSPMASTLITPQGVATLAVFKITNAGSAPAKVTMMKFKRVGISSDSTLNNVYLYNGSARITDSASVSGGMISFSDSSGLVTVPAMGSVAVAVRADVASGVNGQTLGLMLTDVTADAGAVNGLPVSGAQHNFATAPTGMSSADFTGSFSPASGTIDPQNDYVVWQKNLNIGNRDANMTSIRFQQIGSVNADDLKNFRLMVDGVQVGATVEKADANRFVTFAFATPLLVKAGNHVVKMVADIVGGSNRNFNFSLRRVVDVEILDSQLGVVVTPTVAAGTFTTTGMQSTSAISINAGTLTVTKDTTSPSGNIVLNGSGVTFAKFKMKAQGEELKVENLTFGYTATLASGSWGKIRSGAVFADGVQVGSTQDILAAGTQFNLGSSLVLTPGKEVTIEVRGDVFDNDGSNTIAASDTITVSLLAGSSNVYQRASLGYLSNAVQAANQLTAAAGSLTVAKYTAYASQTVTVPQSAYKLGEWRVTSGSSEGVNLDTITVNISSGTVPPAAVTGVYVVYGTKTTASKAVLATTSTFSINEAVPANSTMSFAVYANVDATVIANQNLILSLGVSGTSQTSGNAVTGTAVAGQTITAGTGTLTLAVDASTPVTALVVGNSMPKVASFKFTAQNDAFTITSLTATTTNSSAVTELVFKDGATEIGRQPFDGTTATKTGLSFAIPYNQAKIIDVYANLGAVGTGFGSTGSNVGVSLVAYEKQNSNGVKTALYSASSTFTGVPTMGNNFYVYKTKPTITNVALPTTVLNAGTMTVAKFTVTADAGGAISWRKLKMSFATTTNVAISGWAIYDSANESTALSGVVATTDYNAGTVTFTSASVDQQVSGSKTYVVKALIGGTIASGASVTHSIPTSGLSYVAPTAYASVGGTATFVWSDEAVLGHDGTTADWNNDYLVKNIPTDSQALTK